MKQVRRRGLLLLSLAGAASLTSSSAACSDIFGSCTQTGEACSKDSDCCSGYCSTLPAFIIKSCQERSSLSPRVILGVGVPPAPSDLGTTDLRLRPLSTAPKAQ